MIKFYKKKKTPISLKNSHEKKIESEVKYKRNRLPTGDTACEFQNTRFFLPNLLIDTCRFCVCNFSISFPKVWELITYFLTL